MENDMKDKFDAWKILGFNACFNDEYDCSCVFGDEDPPCLYDGDVSQYCTPGINVVCPPHYEVDHKVVRLCDVDETKVELFNWAVHELSEAINTDYISDLRAWLLESLDWGTK